MSSSCGQYARMDCCSGLSAQPTRAELKSSKSKSSRTFEQTHDPWRCVPLIVALTVQSCVCAYAAYWAQWQPSRFEREIGVEIKIVWVVLPFGWLCSAVALCFTEVAATLTPLSILRTKGWLHKLETGMGEAPSPIRASRIKTRFTPSDSKIVALENPCHRMIWWTGVSLLILDVIGVFVFGVTEMALSIYAYDAHGAAPTWWGQCHFCTNTLALIAVAVFGLVHMWFVYALSCEAIATFTEAIKLWNNTDLKKWHSLSVSYVQLGTHLRQTWQSGSGHLWVCLIVITAINIMLYGGLAICAKPTLDDPAFRLGAMLFFLMLSGLLLPLWFLTHVNSVDIVNVVLSEHADLSENENTRMDYYAFRAMLQQCDKLQIELLSIKVTPSLIAAIFVRAGVQFPVFYSIVCRIAHFHQNHGQHDDATGASIIA